MATKQTESNSPAEGDLRSAALAVAERLRSAGHEAWFVGGCVRDRLLGLPLKDIDIVTNARPGESARLFPGAKQAGVKFAVLLVREGRHEFELATFRTDGTYRDHRHPDRVEYGTREEDAQRRDFTINALYENPWNGEILDLVDGQADLRAGLIRCVGDPERRFGEDALRMLRAIRFAARLGFRIERATWLAMQAHAHSIVHVSAERQRDELTGILTAPHAGEGLRMLLGSGLLRWLLPEVEETAGVEQGGWHTEGDVFEHTVRVLEHLEPRTPVTAWAALLHDVGKPSTFHRDPATGQITFYDHQNVGEELARGILRRLRFPNGETETIARIVRRHMSFMNVQWMKPSTLRRFLGEETIEEELAVHRADSLGSEGLPPGRRLAAYHYCREKLEEFRRAGEEALPPPLVNGRDVMALGLRPGPRVGRLLARVQDEQLEGRLASREEALRWLRERLAENPHFGAD